MKDCNKNVIVFDINDTLISKEFSKTSTLTNNSVKLLSFNVSPKPNLTVLANFLNKRNFILVAWSSMKVKNLMVYIDYLKRDYGIVFDLILDFNHCTVYDPEDGSKVIKKKNLSIVADITGINIDNILLIDNNIEKRMNSQNFYQFSDDNGGLIEVIEVIKRFIE